MKNSAPDLQPVRNLRFGAGGLTFRASLGGRAIDAGRERVV